MDLWELFFYHIGILEKVTREGESMSHTYLKGWGILFFVSCLVPYANLFNNEVIKKILGLIHQFHQSFCKIFVKCVFEKGSKKVLRKVYISFMTCS